MRRDYPRLLVLDLTPIGGGSASGELKQTLLASWDEDALLAVSGSRTLSIQQGASAPTAITPAQATSRIVAFDPEVLLYRPHPSAQSVQKIADELLSSTSLPLALWIMDDWPNLGPRGWRPSAGLRHQGVEQLIARATSRIGISEEMRLAYQKRYGVDFVPVANAVDLQDWPTTAVQWPVSSTGTVSLSYFGSIAPRMSDQTLTRIAKTVRRMRRSGSRIELKISTSPTWRRQANRLDRIDGTRALAMTTSPPLYRAAVQSSHVLILAYNFDRASRRYVHLSLANRLPEYLASGAPIVAVGPSWQPTIRRLREAEAAVVIDAPDTSSVRAGIEALLDSAELRCRIVRNARSAAAEDFELHAARRNFEDLMCRTAATPRGRLG